MVPTTLREFLFSLTRLCFFWLLTPVLIAQTSNQPDPLHPLNPPPAEVRDLLPDKPVNYLADLASIFPPEQATLVSSKCVEFAQRQDIHLYVVTNVYVHGESPQQRAVRLANLWLRQPGRYGAVILYDQGSKGKDAIGLACVENGTGVLDTNDLYRLLINANSAATSAVGSSAQRVQAALDSLLMGFRELKPRLDRGRWGSPRQMLLICMIIGSMGLCLSLLWWVRRMEKKSDAKNHTSFLFPEIVIMSRFGAQCGGGVMAQVDFKNSSPTS